MSYHWGGTRDVSPPRARGQSLSPSPTRAGFEQSPRAQSPQPPRPLTAHAAQFGQAPRFGLGGPTADALANRVAPSHWAQMKRPQTAQPHSAAQQAAASAAAANAAAASSASAVVAPRPPSVPASHLSDLRISLAAQHARNQARLSLALSRATDTQQRFRENQIEVQGAIRQLEAGLDDVDSSGGMAGSGGDWDARGAEYDAMRSNRALLARSLNIHLHRSRSRARGAGGTAGAGAGGSAAISSEETVDSILDALGAWFSTRSARALQDDAVLQGRERETRLEALQIDGEGGSSSGGNALSAALQDMFDHVKLTPAMQASLVSKLRQSTAQALEQEDRRAYQSAAMASANASITSLREQVSALESALTKAANEKARLTHWLAEWGEGAAAAKKIMAGQNMPSISAEAAATAAASVVANGGSLPLSAAVAAANGTASGVPAAGAAAPPNAAATIAALESLLKKKMKQVGELEKRRVKTANQITTLHRSVQDKERMIELMAARLAAANTAGVSSSATLQGSSPASVWSALPTPGLRGFSTSSSHRWDELLWSRQFATSQTHERELLAQMRRIRGYFERFLLESPSSNSSSTAAAGVSTSSAAKEIAHLETLVRVLQSAPSFAPRGVSDAEMVTLLHNMHAGSMGGGQVEREIVLYAQKWQQHQQTTQQQQQVYPGATLLLASSSAASPSLPSSSSSSGSVGTAGAGSPSHLRSSRRGLPLSSTVVNAMAHCTLTFPKFLSACLRWHPLERRTEHARLWRRLSAVFDDVNTSASGRWSIDELEQALRTENIDVTAVEGTGVKGREAGIDGLFITLTTPDPLTVPSSDDVSALLSSTPLTLFHLATFFSVAQLRAIFDAPPAPEVWEANPCRRRQERVSAQAAQLHARNEQREQRAMRARSEAAAAARAGRRGKHVASATAAAAAATSVTSAGEETDPVLDAPDHDESAFANSAPPPLLSQGTKELMLSLLRCDLLGSPVPLADRLQLRYFDEFQPSVSASPPSPPAATRAAPSATAPQQPSLSRTARTTSSSAASSRRNTAAKEFTNSVGSTAAQQPPRAVVPPPFLERAMEALCAPPVAPIMDAYLSSRALAASSFSSVASASATTTAPSSSPSMAAAASTSAQSSALSPRQRTILRRSGAQSPNRTAVGTGGGTGGGGSASSSTTASTSAAVSAAVSPAPSPSPPLRRVKGSPSLSSAQGNPLDEPSEEGQGESVKSSPTDASAAVDTAAASPTSVAAVTSETDSASAATTPPTTEADQQHKLLQFASSLASQSGSPTQGRRATKRASLQLMHLVESDAPPLSAADALSLAHAVPSDAFLPPTIEDVRANLARLQFARSNNEPLPADSALAGLMSSATPFSHEESRPSLPAPAHEAMPAVVHSPISLEERGIFSSSRSAASPTAAAAGAASAAAAEVLQMQLRQQQLLVAAQQPAALPPAEEEKETATSLPSPSRVTPAPFSPRAPPVASVVSALSLQLGKSKAGGYIRPQSAHGPGRSNGSNAHSPTVPSLPLSFPPAATTARPATADLVRMHQQQRQALTLNAAYETDPVAAAVQFSTSAAGAETAVAHAAVPTALAAAVPVVPLVPLLAELEYKEAEARTFRQLYESEKARTAKLERLLHLVSASSSSGGHSSATEHAWPVATAAVLPVRPLMRAQGGSLSARERLSSAAALRKGRARGVAQDAPSAAHTQFGALLSRREDAGLVPSSGVLAPHTLHFAPPSSLPLHAPPPPYPRLLQQPKLAGLLS